MNPVPTELQISAGGVAFRRRESKIEIALISTGAPARWQLPKGIVGKNEHEETAAQREVREEAGITTELITLIEKIEYWYFATKRGGRVRFHKHVYFYLLRYISGDTRDHDHEVKEAQWVEIEEAKKMLTFKNEKNVVAQAQRMIDSLSLSDFIPSEPKDSKL